MFDNLKEDIESIKMRDPAARSTLEIFLTYPGFYAILFHRSNHYFWKHGFKLLARVGSNLSRFITGIEIHPGAQIGSLPLGRPQRETVGRCASTDRGARNDGKLR